MPAGRHLFLVSSEFRPFARKTGLAEFNGLAKALLRKGRWSGVSLIMPCYRGVPLGPGAETDGRHTVVQQRDGLEYHLLALGPPFPMDVDEHWRISGALPPVEPLWQEFAQAAWRIVAAREAQVDGLDVMAIDWPAGPFVALLRGKPIAKCPRVVFTVDLPPEAEAARRLWQAGIEEADTLHVPTPEWWARLTAQPEYPWLPAQGHKARFVRFGIDLGEYAPDHRTASRFNHALFKIGAALDTVRRAKGVAKEAVQELKGLEQRQDAMLFVCANRWSLDDQKNHMTILHFINRLLDLNERVQLLIEPLRPDALGKATWPLEALASLGDQEQWRGRLALPGPLRGGAKLSWIDRLRAADAQLVPSRYEPCGLNHAQGMPFGVVPICSRAGAMGEAPMADARDGSAEGNSFLFDWDEARPIESAQALWEAMAAAAHTFLHQPERWAQIMTRTMRDATENSWDHLADDYVARLF